MIRPDMDTAMDPKPDAPTPPEADGPFLPPGDRAGGRFRLRGEHAIIAAVVGAVVLIHFWAGHKLIVINFFFLPVVAAALLLGKRVGCAMAAFCVVLVGTSAYLEPAGYELRIDSARGNYSFLLLLDIVIWGALLGLTALLVGHLPTMRARQRRFERIASVDALTGLLNRRAFMERADEAVSLAARHGLPLSFVMADIDRFKQCNDTHGHQAGDAMLRCFAGLLGKECRKEDFAGRFGGDEFCLVLPHTTLEQSRRLAERLNARWAETRIEHEGQTLSSQASFGVACVDPENPRGSVDASGLVREADKAMYAAKRSGRNRVVCADGVLDGVGRGV